MLDYVDCIATDHAPHTREEKAGGNPPPGVPGLETALPLMLTAVHEGRLTLPRLIELMSSTPRGAFSACPRSNLTPSSKSTRTLPGGSRRTAGTHGRTGARSPGERCAGG